MYDAFLGFVFTYQLITCNPRARLETTRFVFDSPESWEGLISTSHTSSAAEAGKVSRCHLISAKRWHQVWQNCTKAPARHLTRAVCPFIESASLSCNFGYECGAVYLSTYVSHPCASTHQQWAQGFNDGLLDTSRELVTHDTNQRTWLWLRFMYTMYNAPHVAPGP